MRILIIGAGVTGSIYASFLINAKDKLEQKLKEQVDIKILARGETYTRINEHGLKIKHHIQNITTIDQIPVIKTLETKDIYDYVLIFLRKTQVASLLPDIAINQSKHFVFLGNNGTGTEEYSKSISNNKIVLGFPGVGGKREDDVIVSVHRDKPPVTIGAVSAQSRQKVRRLAKILRIAKIKVDLSNNIDSWLKYHIALVSPIANGIYYDGGDNYTLAENNDVLKMIVKAIREGHVALRSLKFPAKPAKLMLMMLFPDFLIKGKIKKLLSTETGRLVTYEHCMAAPEEMLEMTNEFKSIIADSPIPIDNIEKLFEQKN